MKKRVQRTVCKTKGCRNTFVQNKRGGPRQYCVSCAKTRQKEVNRIWGRARYQRNPEKAKASARAWRKKNPEKVKASARAWKKKNPEKVKASARAWRKKNPEKARANDRAWKKKNPEKVKANDSAWRKRKPDTHLRGLYKCDLVRALNLLVKPAYDTRKVRTTEDINNIIILLINAVKKQPEKAHKLVGLNSLPNDCRLIEGKTASDSTSALQFIRAAMDEPASLRYELFPTKEDRERKTNGYLYLSVWDVLRALYGDVDLKKKAARRWLRYEKLVRTLRKKNDSMGLTSEEPFA
jgi:hypothetical protein